MSAIDQVIEWAKSIPDWQADAVRRILTQEVLTDQDKAELLAILKEQHGLGNSQQPAPKPNPIIKGQVSGAPQSKVNIVLKSLKNIKRVNAIPDDSYIDFGEVGLTVIYGGNGTGKSGYARILKRACSARDTIEPIQPNVFGPQQSGPASALFTVSINGAEEKPIIWTDGGVKEDVLTNIVVFDSKEARVIVDEEKNVGFLPYGAHVFGHLVELLKELKVRLANEKPTVKKLDFRDVPQNTISGKFLIGLSAITPDATFESFVHWTKDDADKLAALKVKISEAESPDKTANIRKLKAIFSSVESLKNDISKIDSALSVANEESIKEAIDEAVVAEQSLSVVAEESAGNEPLPGVGSKTWQALYRAAQAYSVSEAYPGKPFPVVESNSRCVLCMQLMLGETSERFHRFHEFMEESAKKKQELSDVRLKSKLGEISGLDFSKFDESFNVVTEIRERDGDVALKVEEFKKIMKSRQTQLVEAIGKKAYKSFQEPLEGLNEEVSKVSLAIRNEIAELETVTPDQLLRLKADCQELQARENLFAYKDKINQHIETLRVQKKYDEAMAETSLNAVSARGKVVISQALTPELQKTLKEELEKLEASYLPIETNPTRSDGDVVYKFSLTKATLPKKVTLTDILSEGEQRVAAIAGFFAELQASGEKNPIVLDDPVSSLDHVFRNRIALRVAQEAQSRQVIVFTHDIAFLVALQKYSEEIGKVTVTTQTIRRKGNVPGLSAKGVPWHAMRVGQRLEHLASKKIPEFEGQYQDDMEKYNDGASNFYGMLRETWEAFVEEELLYLVVRRHSAEVQTIRLSGVEVSDDDHIAVFQAMSKCSEWMTGHDKSKSLDVNRPSPKEIKADMNKLQELIGAVRKRRAKTIEGRKSG